MPAMHMSKAMTAGTEESGPHRRISFSSTDLFLFSADEDDAAAAMRDLASATWGKSCMQGPLLSRIRSAFSACFFLVGIINY